MMDCKELWRMFKETPGESSFSVRRGNHGDGNCWLGCEARLPGRHKPLYAEGEERACRDIEAEMFEMHSFEPGRYAWMKKEYWYNGAEIFDMILIKYDEHMDD